MVCCGLASAFALALAGCSKSGADLSSSSPTVAVQTVPAKVQPIEQIIHGQGILYPIHQASLSPKITAPVERFYVNRGTRVRRGELLAVLANQDLAAGVVSARGAYDQAQANFEAATSSTLPEEIQVAEAAVTDAKSSLDAQQRVYASEQQLYREGAIARKQVDATAVALTAAKSAWKTVEKRLSDLKASGEEQQRKAAKGQMEAAQGQYLRAVAELGYTRLRSPIDGVVADRAVYPGDIAPAGTPLLVIMDTSKIVLRLHIPQPQAAQLRLGDPATLEIPNIEGGLPARVSIISPALDPSSTTVEIWLEADNPHGELTPGSSVAASIVVRKVADALVVPDSAVLAGGDGGSRVMVVDAGGIAYSRPVTTGIRNAGLVEILSGLRPGEQVIVGGAYGLPDKTKVKATPASESAPENQD